MPEAHVEASTEGSVLLAGLLLKLRIFGVIKFLIPIWPNATIFFQPFVSIQSNGVVRLWVHTQIRNDPQAVGPFIFLSCFCMPFVRLVARMATGLFQAGKRDQH